MSVVRVPARRPHAMQSIMVMMMAIMPEVAVVAISVVAVVTVSVMAVINDGDANKDDNNTVRAASCASSGTPVSATRVTVSAHFGKNATRRNKTIRSFLALSRKRVISLSAGNQGLEDLRNDLRNSFEPPALSSVLRHSPPVPTIGSPGPSAEHPIAQGSHKQQRQGGNAC
jgi:hypothetical protein